MKDEPCPFVVGQQVVYQPSLRGVSCSIMTDLGQKMIIGGTYTIARIDKGVYVVVVGHEDAIEGGLYWTEFERCAEK